MTGIITAIIVSILPFLYLFTQVKILGNFTYAFANIAGFIGGIFLFWEFILGIKPLAQKITQNPAVFMKLHIFLGVWGMFFVFIHPLLEMFSYVEHITFLFLPNISSSFNVHVTYGRIAFLLVILVWLTSTFLRQNISYKKWINIHYLSYPMMFFVFIHALEIGSFINAFILIKLYWILLLGLYSLLTLWRIYEAIKNYKNIMNIKKNSLMVLGLVLGVSVILYIFDVPILSSPSQITPTIIVPTITPAIKTIETLQTQVTITPSTSKKYSAIVTYDPEGRSESINVSLTLNGTIITEVSSIHSMNDGKSRRYQMDFESSIKSLVVGKDINSLNLSRVAGASSTTDAFMQAIQKIRNTI